PRVLKPLPDEEHDAEDDRRNQPVAEASAVAAFDGVDGDLHGHARQEKLDGVESGEPDTEYGVDLPCRFFAEHRLPLGDTSAEEEVRGEERAEEEGLARDEQDDRPHACGESRWLRLEAGLVRREAVGGVRPAATPDRPVPTAGPHGFGTVS